MDFRAFRVDVLFRFAVAGVAVFVRPRLDKIAFFDFFTFLFGEGGFPAFAAVAPAGFLVGKGMSARRNMGHPSRQILLPGRMTEQGGSLARGFVTVRLKPIFS